VSEIGDEEVIRAFSESLNKEDRKAGQSRGHDSRSRDQRDGLQSWRKGLGAKGCRWPLEATRVKKMGSPLIPPKGTQPYWCLDCRLLAFRTWREQI
jgi:hypothetical protein